MRRDFSRDETFIGVSVAMGIVFGAVIGVATDDVGLWIAIGIVVGAVAGVVRARQR